MTSRFLGVVQILLAFGCAPKRPTPELFEPIPPVERDDPLPAATPHLGDCEEATPVYATDTVAPGCGGVLYPPTRVVELRQAEIDAKWCLSVLDTTTLARIRERARAQSIMDQEHSHTLLVEQDARVSRRLLWLAPVAVTVCTAGGMAVGFKAGQAAAQW